MFCAYVLSFVYVGIYWNNHHHLMHAAKRVNGRVLWANLHVLFWLSLFPFTTNWMGENHLASWPTALYGFDLFMTALAWYILARALISLHGANSMLERGIGDGSKTILSAVLYLVAIGASFWEPWVAAALYTIVAVLWLVPDRRLEKVLLMEEP